MKSYSNNATSYYLWNENIEARDDFTFTDKDFIAMLKTYDEVVILDDHYTFNALTKKLLDVPMLQEFTRHLIFLRKKDDISHSIKLLTCHRP